MPIKIPKKKVIVHNRSQPVINSGDGHSPLL